MEENYIIDPTTVPGWGVDADPENDPTYPMKNRTNGEHAGYTWKRPPLQPVDVEVLHSNERPNVTAAFGTSTPPAKVSGIIRRAAFRFSENSYMHWVPLVLADRIGVVEGLVDDLAHGHVPNYFGERGWKAEWEHDPKRVIRKVLVVGLVAGAAYRLLGGGNSRRRRNYEMRALPERRVY